jgi:ABC-2 type transport system permease protein
MTKFFQTLSDIRVLTWRNLIRYIRLPQLLIFNAILNVVLLLLFNYVFGGAIKTGGSSYIQYFLPGFLAQIVVFGSTQTSVGVAEDFSKGFIDRFRSLPMARPAFLTGRVLSDALRYALLLLLLVGVGLGMGFRFHTNIGQIASALALIVLFGVALTWLGVYIGVSVKSVETAQVAGFVWVFPLVFASSLYVPIATMPGWLQAFAKINPLTSMADVTRGLMLGGSVSDPLWKILAWDAALILVFMSLAFRRYNRFS